MISYNMVEARLKKSTTDYTDFFISFCVFRVFRGSDNNAKKR